MTGTAEIVASDDWEQAKELLKVNEAASKAKPRALMSLVFVCSVLHCYTGERLLSATHRSSGKSATRFAKFELLSKTAQTPHLPIVGLSRLRNYCRRGEVIANAHPLCHNSIP
jgi:hypothetical protein